MLSAAGVQRLLQKSVGELKWFKKKRKKKALNEDAKYSLTEPHHDRCVALEHSRFGIIFRARLPL